MKKLTGSIQRDDLSDLLHAVRFRGVLLCRSELSAPWGFSVLGRDFASFHLVTRGRCCVDVEGVEERLWLSKGDLVILPGGNAHTVRDSPGSPSTRLEELVAGPGFDGRGTLRTGGGGDRTVIVCGGFQFDDPAADPIVASLPPVIHLRSRGPVVGSWLRMALAFLSHEAEAGRPGADAAVARLADLLFIEALRVYFAAPENARSGLAAALRDPRIAAAVLAIQRQPESPWGVAKLARQVSMSRTAFAVRFRALVGESPMAYVIRCRMHKASGMLRSSDETIGRVAERVGYDSPASFGRAFRRWNGASPAAYRSLRRNGEPLGRR
jgi:AraC-like DNA-binding protein